jgi:hypothetical protein
VPRKPQDKPGLQAERTHLSWERSHTMVKDGLAELWAATSVEKLHRLLMTRQVGGRSGQHQEAVELFGHHHGDDPGGAVDTAVLLCTDGGGTDAPPS